MPRPSKGEKTPGSGRQKGVVNKKNADLQAKADEIGVDPFHVLLLWVKRDWKALGYEKPTVTKVLKDGGTLEVEICSPEKQIECAKEVAQYLYPKRKAIEHSTNESQGFVIKIEDYGVKK